MFYKALVSLVYLINYLGGYKFCFESPTQLFRASLINGLIDAMITCSVFQIFGLIDIKDHTRFIHDGNTVFAADSQGLSFPGFWTPLVV